MKVNKQKFQQIYLSELEKGDRFYFGAKKADVCEFVKKEKGSLRNGPEYFWTLNGKEDSSKKIGL